MKFDYSLRFHGLKFSSYRLLDFIQFIIQNELLLYFVPGETVAATESPDSSPVHQKTLKRKRADRTMNNNGPISTPLSASDYALLNNNNNHVKNERLSPGTPDTSSRSRYDIFCVVLVIQMCHNRLTDSYVRIYSC